VNILVTGSAGFIGSHVYDQLVAAGHNVFGVDSLEQRVHGYPTQHGRVQSRTRYWDIPDDVLGETDVLIHLAAQVGVADSMTNPVWYTHQNSWGTAKLLDTITKLQSAPGFRLKHLIVASSMSVYGDPSNHQPSTRGKPGYGGVVDERSEVQPESIYGLTKYDQERQCLLWSQVSGIPVTALRFFNVYGPRQALHNPYTGVIANFANWLLNNEQPVVYEDGQQTRDFVYVEDVAKAVYWFAQMNQLERGGEPSVYNISTGLPTTIEQMADLLAHGLGKDIEPNITNERRPGDIRHCIGDCHKLASVMPDWSPRSVEDGLAEYCNWLLRSGVVHV